MSEALYNLTITQHSSSKPIEQLVQDLLEIMQKTGDAYLEYKLSESLLFEQSSSAVLENVTLAEGERYQKLFLEQKVETALHPALQLVAKDDDVKNDETYLCPACQHQQAKAEGESDVCEKCGVAIAKYNEKIKKQQKRKAIYETEKRKLEQAQAESLKTAQVQADHDETESLREAARKKLGIKKKKQTAIAVVSVAAVLAAGLSGYFIYNELDKSAETTTNTNSESVMAGASDNNTQNTPAGKGISTATALQAIQTLTGNSDSEATVGVQGKDAPLSQSETQTALLKAELPNAKTSQLTVVPSKLSVQQLEGLKHILQSPQTKTFGNTESGQYAKLLPKLKRLLELGKPNLGLIFAENSSDSYSAALLILEVANSEQQKKSSLLHDDILLTMKSMAVKTDSGQIAPLLTSALSQAHTMTGDSASAETLLEKAIQEAENKADTLEQNIQWLTRMLIDHEHFNHSAGAEKLVNKLEYIAGNTVVSTPEGQLAVSSIYSHLAAISIGSGDISDATGWLKKIPIENTSEQLQTYLTDI